jgi:hypothetical protein
LRSAAVDLAWYQYQLLDVIAVLFLIIVAIFIILYIMVKKLFSLCRGTFQNTNPKEKKS